MKDIDKELLTACENGHTDIVELLLDRGSDINVKDEYGNTPLIMASRNGHVDIIQLLLDNGADIEVTDNRGLTAINYAFNNIEDDKERREALEVFNQYHPEAFITEYLDRSAGR
jgi:ankyrin repeat protein